MALIVAMGIGAVSIAPLEVVAILFGRIGLELPWEYSDRQETVLTAIRIPRVLATALVGAAWAGAGVAMQGLYRSPLADPALVGIGGGAALGAAIGLALAVVLGIVTQVSGTVLVTGAAFAAALLAAVIVYRVASASGHVVVATMLLAGIALTALFAALTALVVAASRSPELGTLAFWSLGSFSGVVGRDVVIAVVVTIPALVLLARLGPRLDALALGEIEARHLGIDVPRLTVMVSIIFALLTAVAVAVAGVIAFVALMVPSLVRSWVGRPHRVVVVGSALLGATFVVIADVLARSVFAPTELSIGVLTTLVGAPFFLWLLLRDRGLLAR
ncbi:MAG: FecCD family ABC transporter permease [Chloroflexota bacterium]